MSKHDQYCCNTIDTYFHMLLQKPHFTARLIQNFMENSTEHCTSTVFNEGGTCIYSQYMLCTYK